MPNALAIKPWFRPVFELPRGADFVSLRTWLLCWLVLPNLPFLPVTLMGGPPRFREILLCGIVALFARSMNYWIRLTVFVGILGYMVINFISHMFNMHISMILSVVGLVADIQPAVSPEYVAGAGLLAAMLALAIWLLRQDGNFTQSRHAIVAMIAIFALAGADVAISRGTMGSYSRTAPEDTPFSSASHQADLLGLADGKTNLMVVVVEAMGQPTDPRLAAQLDKIWMRPELADKYVMSRGDTAFFGSTTSGEMRELCQRWGNYDEIKAFDTSCVPAILAQKGYRTTAFHSFTKKFFDRQTWYPLIGFQDMVFGEELKARGVSFCPNVFPGACDREVPALIGKQLAQGGKPQFIYWLTLNSHLPIVENRELGTENCQRLGHGLDEDYPMICRLFSIWSNTADALVKVVDRPDFPPTDILIVGDHMPPFTHQKSRLQFDPEHVPWILLRHREAASEPAVAQAHSGTPRAAL
jgi:Sulfatase